MISMSEQPENQGSPLICNEMSIECSPLLSENQRRNLQISIIGCLALGIFMADWITPPGIGVGNLYILVILATLPLNDPLVTKVAAFSSTVLVVFNFLASSPVFEYEPPMINRGISIFCILITGFMVLRNIATQQALHTLKEDLAAKYGLRTHELKEQNRAMLNLLDDMEQVKNTLEDKERRLHLLVDAFPSGMLIVDRLGKIVFANKLVETLFGYSRHDLVGQSIDRLVPERFQQEHSHHRVGFLQSPSTRAMGAGRDLFARRKDGSEFPVEIGLNPINTPEGLMVLSSVVDITARKNSAIKLERLNQQLVTQNQELEAYAYAVSHDLRAPLRAIHNYADFLLEDLSTKIASEQKEYLTGITTAVCEAEELVSDLLELSRLNTDDSRSQPCPIEPLIQKILRTLNFDKEVQIQTPTKWPTIHGQEYLLRQIFQNLIANGVKFNQSPSKRIELNWCQEENGFVRFFVCDNGIGISQQYQTQIFQIFQRLHTTKEYEGTGIGLAIVKKAVTKLGGEVSVESEEGKGSVFSFTVPIGENQHDE